MLELDQTLPEGVLLGAEETVLTQALARTGGLRFVAREADLVWSDERITGWRATDGATLARTSEPNEGNSRFEATPRPALVFRDGTNCGFVLPAFAQTVGHFTAAVLYASAGEARTLVSVSTGQSNNQIFMNEKGGQLTAADRAGTVQIDLPSVSGPQVKLAILSFSGAKLTLRLGRASRSVAAKVPGLAHPADFFIGCRSNRSGIAKTQGSMRLHEVCFWPERSLLDDPSAEAVAALTALDRHLRWSW